MGTEKVKVGSGFVSTCFKRYSHDRHARRTLHPQRVYLVLLSCCCVKTSRTKSEPALLFLSGNSDEKLVCCRISATTSGNSSVVPKHVSGSYSADAICVNEMPSLRISTENKRRCWEMTPLIPQNKDQILEKVIIFSEYFLSVRVAPLGIVNNQGKPDGGVENL